MSYVIYGILCHKKTVCKTESEKQSDYMGFYYCLVAKSCLILCDAMDYSPPDSSVYGVSQAGILEWVAISFSRGSSDPGIEAMSPLAPALLASSLPLGPLGCPRTGVQKSYKCNGRPPSWRPG